MILCAVALVVSALAFRSRRSFGSAQVSKLFGYTRKLEGASPGRKTSTPKIKPTGGAQGKVKAPVKPPGESLDRLELELLSKYGSNAYKDALEEWDDEEDEGVKKSKAKDRAAAQKGALAQYGMVGKFQGFGGSGATKAPSKLGAAQKPADASENYSIDDIFDDLDDGEEEEEEEAVPAKRAPALLTGRLGRRLAPAPAATLAAASKRPALTVADLLDSADTDGSIGSTREAAPAKKERWARRGVNAEEEKEVVENAGAGAGSFENSVVGTRRYSVPSGSTASITNTNANTNTAAVAAFSQPRAHTIQAPTTTTSLASPQPAFRLRQPPPKTAEEIDKEAAVAARAQADEEARTLRRKQRRVEEKSEYLPFDFSLPLSSSTASVSQSRSTQTQAADGDDEEAEAGEEEQDDVDVEADRVFSSVTFEELFASSGFGFDPAVLSAADAQAQAQALALAQAQAQAQLLVQPKTKGRAKSNTASMPQALLAPTPPAPPAPPTPPTQPTQSQVQTSTILANLASMKLFTPTRVQEKALPVLAGGRDAIIHAQTGAGKTLAFLLPLLSVVDPAKNRVQALVLAPSRELVTQTAAVAERLFFNTGIRVAAIIGGANVRGQVDKLRSTRPQVLVASPGRLAELVFRLDKLRLGNVRAVVLDEVDNLLQEAYRGDVELLLEASGVGRSRLREGAEAKAKAAAAMAAKGLGVEPVRSELQGRIEQRLGVASDADAGAGAGADEDAVSGGRPGDKEKDKEREQGGEYGEEDEEDEDGEEPAAEQGRGAQFICLASATGNSPAVSAFADRYCPGGWDKVAIDAASALPRTITHALISSPRMRALEQLRKLLAAKPEVVR